jgi:hypothetical protein
MNAPLQPYRIALDYEALEDAFLDRIEDLNTTFEQIDVAAGFTRGNTQKLLSKSRERWARTFGVESLGKMLKGTGLAIVLVLDDERFQAIKDELVKRRRRRSPAMAGKRQPVWLFTKRKARQMGKRRFALMSESERKRHQRKAQKAMSRSRRRKRRAMRAGALLNNLSHSSLCDGKVASPL